MRANAALVLLLCLCAAPVRASAPSQESAAPSAVRTSSSPEASLDRDALDAAEGRDLHGPPAPGKKALWLLAKAGGEAKKPPRRRLPKPAAQAQAPLTLSNLWTHEVLPLAPGASLGADDFSRFLRCHHTNQSTTMDLRLLGLLRNAAAHFQSRFIEIVSGFRAPKYNLALRKKGHQVARDSQHTHGNAVDFRVAGVPVQELRRYVSRHRLGGVGYYPRSQFIHADTGPTRSWTAE